MKKNITQFLIALIVVFGVVGFVQAKQLWEYNLTHSQRAEIALEVGIIADLSEYKDTDNLDQNLAILEVLQGQEFSIPAFETSFGALVQPIAGTTYNLAGAGISSSDNSITLQSLTLPQTGYEITDSDLSDTFYITLEPGNKNRQEIVSCTTVTQNSNDTATLSGCTRGLLPISPYTASTTYAFSHGGSSQVIFSDPPQLYNQFSAKTNVETISKVWTFDRYPVASSTLGIPTTTYQLATKQYVDNVGAGGFTASNIGTNQGLQALNTSPETVGVLLNTTGALATSSAGLAVRLSPTGGLATTSNRLVVDGTDTFTFSGDNIHTGNETYYGSNTSLNASSSLTAYEVYKAASAINKRDLVYYDDPNIEYRSGDDAFESINGANWIAQNWTYYNGTMTVDALDLKLYQQGTPAGDLTVAIYATGANRKPTGSALSSDTFTSTQISATTPGVFYRLDMPDLELTPSTTYATVLSCASCADSSNDFNWRLDSSGPTYANHESLTSGDSGSSWSLVNTKDHVFEVIGLSGLYVTDSDYASTTERILGFAANSGSTSSTIRVLNQRGSKISGFTNLNPNHYQYVSSTPGLLGWSKPFTNANPVGWSASKTTVIFTFSGNDD